MTPKPDHLDVLVRYSKWQHGHYSAELPSYKEIMDALDGAIKELKRISKRTP